MLNLCVKIFGTAVLFTGALAGLQGQSLYERMNKSGYQQAWNARDYAIHQEQIWKASDDEKRFTDWCITSLALVIVGSVVVAFGTVNDQATMVSTSRRL